ncbi:translational GTPase TypA [bacterium]|jgi:GTP-binding protein|nr:translational GTPase TypA [bacterium]MBT6831452.1 translational GTPase TypA [bacterium]MBT6996358.1 translational GTPase TypA [bacterium]MBT7772425.1 translational GTPase TypA [bacterium]
MQIRNIAIIAHVDHGKTTLVDALLKAGGVFSEHETVATRVMDSDAQERERGITIYAKNAAIQFHDTKINIVDTPGHADFGSEVERVLKTVDATILVVDAYEGPMPQTKFVLRKSLEQGKKVLVVVNKIDKQSARPEWVIDQIFDLFVKLGATNEQLDFPYMYSIAREGIAVRDLSDERKNIEPLLDFILENVPEASKNTEANFRMQPAMLAYDNFLGRMAIGRVHEGTLKINQMVTILSPTGEKRSGKISKLFTFRGMQHIPVESVSAGDIVVVAGLSDIFVGETIASSAEVEPLPAIRVDPPSLAMNFMVNDSPFAGNEGKFVTSRQIRDRLEKELETNVGLHVDFSSDEMRVLGRGEMHLAVLIESMRREGFELQVSQPEVVFQEINGVQHEPIENVVINIPEEIGGKIIELMSQRKGKMTNMNSENGMTQMEFEIPMRGLLGIRSNFIILTKGEGTMYSSFARLEPNVGVIEKRQVGSLISGEAGIVTGYSLWKLQERGPIFIHPATTVYEGMIIGEHNQGTDLTVNPIKGKQLTNVRSSGADDAIALTPPLEVTLEKALEYIKEDEYVEITPKNIRLRKKCLTELERKRKK